MVKMNPIRAWREPFANFLYILNTSGCKLNVMCSNTTGVFSPGKHNILKKQSNFNTTFEKEDIFLKKA